MDFVKAFTFVFDDPDWIKKVGIIALVALIPVVGTLVLLGYALEAGQRVVRQDAQLLPNLEFGAQLGLGFKSFLIGLVYSIPAILIYLPMILVPIFLSGNGDNNTSNSVAVGVMVCCGGLLLLYGILMIVLIPAAHGNFIATGQLGAAFRFGEIFSLLRAAPGAYLMVLVGALLGGFIAPLGGIACGVGVILTSAYVSIVMGSLYGRAYNAAIANGALRL